MRLRLSSSGFTIIETLIFLSISAFVFLASITQFTRQQHVVQFNNGISDIQSIIQTTIHEVSSSYPPSILGYRCTADTSNNPVVFTVTTTTANNTDCVFLGKAIAVGNDVACTKNNMELCSRYSIMPIVGRREFYDPAGGTVTKPPSTFAQTRPKALATCLTNDDNPNSFPCGTNPATARPDLADRKRLKNGVSIYRAFIRNPDGTSQRSVGGVAFMLGLNRTTNDNANSVDMVWLDTPFEGNTESRVTTAIEALGIQTDDNLYRNPAGGIALCIAGAYGELSEIIVGSNNSQLDVRVVPTDQIDIGCN